MLECEPCRLGTQPSPDRDVCVEVVPEHSSGPCKAGSFGPGGRLCKSCIGNTVTRTSNQKQCTPCPRGEVANDDRTACRRLFSTKESTTTVTTGEYAAATIVDVASNCPPGFFGDGDFSCVRCPNGQVSASYGARECTRCPAGSVPNLAHSKCIASDTAPNLGTERPTDEAPTAMPSASESTDFPTDATLIPTTVMDTISVSDPTDATP